MASNITELMALLSGPNRASSSSIPPPVYGSMVDPSPWVPPILAPENDVVPIPAPTHFSATVPPLTHAPEVYPSVAPLPVTLPVTFPPPPTTVPIIDPAMLALPPMPVSATSTHAPAPIVEPFPFPAPQPQISLPHRTPSILNIPSYNPDAQAVAATEAPPTYILPATEIEQERRMKRMEEMMKALQESDSRYHTSYLDLNLFPDMRLPPKIKIPDFDKYDGTTDPKPHLQGYRNRMMPYWGYEQFMIQTFQESLKGAALSWFTSLKAADIPTWDELAKKFVTQYGYNTGIAPSYLELSVMEMQEEQSFEDYATQWRAEAAKHRPPIDEAEQIQIFHGTLKGAYYSHLLGHMSSFNAMIKAGKKLSFVEDAISFDAKEQQITIDHALDPDMKDSKDSNILADITSTALMSLRLFHRRIILPRSNNIQFNRFTTQLLLLMHLYRPRSLLVSNILRPFKCNQAGPRLRVLLSRPSGPQLREPSKILSQLLIGNRIRMEAPGPNFDPTVQNQNLRCEFHQGAPGHTTDNCHVLRGRLRELIDKKLLSFNEVKPPNVQTNPLPDHVSSSGPTVNMIGAYPLGKDKTKEE
ncbi:uncharacterized protein LOC116204148 [Punica granatum]|uniref:Uncharacterized protein LOC116204148 n=1 Tax=Punica granatum TaxID=22663 RepID=A0A6P8DKB1_PUNGR|nr:uncharacterized protein LOC116204148 [Punica granatum]